jgi:putative alpha-1,2-mannosidase
MPFVTTPFGMTSWTPQTRQNKISVTSYNYDDTTISGFIGTHHLRRLPGGVQSLIHAGGVRCRGCGSVRTMSGSNSGE